MSSKITLYGYESYLHDQNDSLFKNILLPASDLLNKDDLVDNILLECGEFEPVYSDPDFLKFAIENFFKTNYRTFNKWLLALAIEYKPLENYNRTEEESYKDLDNIAEIHTTIDGIRKSSEVQGKITEKSHLGKETTEVDPPDTSDVRDYSQPYNSGQTDATTTTLFDKQTVTKLTDSVTGNNKTVTTVYGDITDPDTRETEGDINKPHTVESGHLPGQMDTNTIKRMPKEIKAYGNIGVTTSQQMLQSELDIALFNVYKRITTMFMCELTIPIYE